MNFVRTLCAEIFFLLYNFHKFVPQKSTPHCQMLDPGFLLVGKGQKLMCSKITIFLFLTLKFQSLSLNLRTHFNAGYRKKNFRSEIFYANHCKTIKQKSLNLHKLFFLSNHVNKHVRKERQENDCLSLT